MKANRQWCGDVVKAATGRDGFIFQVTTTRISEIQDLVEEWLVKIATSMCALDDLI